MKREITLPLTKEIAVTLRAGDIVSLSGYIYTGRDAAHKRMVEGFEKTGKFPFDLKNQVIYYVGPSPAKPGNHVGSAGPTTSGRMDAYAPIILDNGSTGMIGKGSRTKEVIEAMKRNKAVYFGATGGAAALIAKHIKSAEVIDYSDLGTEAIHRFYVDKLPLVVIIDCDGNNLYETEKEKYRG
ncbi:fumarate hydratase class I, aerobic [Clostridiales bacterium]|nr:fumarate hydratase class I, aerobic [Clostridiales bacterium]